MTKKSFITMILSTIGGVLFALGMCMCLIAEWSAFKQGVVVAVIGALVLLAMVITRTKMRTKPFTKPSKKTIAIVLLSVIGALVLGVGMCMTMVWQGLMIPGIIVGIIGILLLLCLVPVCKGGLK